jgi:mannose-6-phosphate isomerase-like protein (cupin superfamily)
LDFKLKMNYFTQTEELIKSKGFKIVSKDLERPWGGFLVIDENQVQDFLNHFFKGINIEGLKISGKLSPKILMVKPDARLSWQYHHRRAEIWRVFKGEVGIITSEDNTENEMKVYSECDQITLKQGERHRLIGLDDFGVVAEIWQHTDINNPSNEEDIVRVQDDFGR